MVRILGAILIVCGVSYCGFESALAYKRTLTVMRELQSVLEVMQTEIRFRLLPVRDVFQLCSEHCVTSLKSVFSRAYAIMNADAASSPQKALSASVSEHALPKAAADVLIPLSRRLGQSDLEGQIQALGLAQTRLSALIDRMEREQPARCKSCCAVGVSAGIALAILLV